MSRPNVTASRAACLCITLIFTSMTYATEGGGTSYPLGVNTVGAGKMPPPGFTEFFYLSDYRAGRILDGDGDRKAGIHDFDLNIQALSIRVDYVYQDVSFLGAKLASRVALPLVKGDISFNVDTPAGRMRRSNHQEGIGDLTVVPFVLGWSSPRYHQLFGLDVFVPVGSYDKDRLFNPGRNTWAYGPWYSFTAYPLENLEVSAKLIYMINGENKDTDYRSGHEFNADYNIGYNVTREWQFGLNGYLYKQVSDDEKDGHTYLDGNRGQVAAIGPALKYQTPEFGFVMKWQHETHVENRASGDRIWLQAVYRF
ncbi:SphA family protein [Pseudomonas putida]|uniref:SphA family protein n=1 Tax=Pseudomonas putida TaxID=303 RepID=UPI003465ADDA